MNKQNQELHLRLLAMIPPGFESTKYDFHPGKVTDLDGDGFGEPVFAITAGFSKQPRKVFA